MNLTLYASAWCPRCRRAADHLAELLGPAAATRLLLVDALCHPVVAWRAGIRMIPALTCNGETISGLTLDRTRIETFLVRHNLIPSPRTSRR